MYWHLVVVSEVRVGVSPVLLNGEQIVRHGLVGELVQQGRERVEGPAVERHET